MTEFGSSTRPKSSRRSSRLPPWPVWSLAALAGVWGCGRPLPNAPLHFEVSLETQNCDQNLREVIIQLDKPRGASGQAYRFAVDPTQQKLEGTIRDLREGTYRATVIGRTSDDKKTCSRDANVLVSNRDTSRATLKLTCDQTCESSTREVNTIACPSLSPELPAATQFTDAPFRVKANQQQAQGGAVWKSREMSFSGQGDQVRATCKQASRNASATVTAANAACAVRESVNVKCVDAKVLTLSTNNVLAPDWPGAVPGRNMPITRTVYRASCDAVVQRQLASAKTCTSVGRNYCSCEWAGPPPNDATVATSFDGPVLGGAADAGVSEEQLEKLREQLIEIGRGYLGVPPAPTGETALQAQQLPVSAVRVAVIDTSAVPPYDLQSGAPTQPLDNNLHGRAVALVIADTACSAFGKMNECPIKVHSYLALNVLGSHNGETATLGIDNVHGGNAGTLTDFAVAIRRAVDDWKPNAANERLIINLSAGWDPIWGGTATSTGEVTGTPALVMESLQYANCSGALVFAAAGNRTTPFGSATPETAIFPAAWTALAAPSAEQCAALGVSDAKPDPKAALLHAVGGLDFHGGQLMMGRPRGLPQLATLGLNVVRHEPYGAPHHTPTLTGTSMSTAAVSGVAANLWMSNPAWTAPYLADQLYQRGQPTDHTANVCLGGNECNTVRNVVLCGTNGNAAAVGCNPKPPELELPEGSLPEFEEPIPLEVEPAGSTESGDGAEPWIYPQPADDPSCRVCQFHNNSRKLDIHWISSFDPKRITQMRIYLKDNSGYWTIPQDIATNRRSFRVTLNGASEAAAGTVRYKYDLGPEVITIEESLIIP